MNCTQSLPEGYRQILKVDLQEEERLKKLLNALAAGSALALMPLGLLFVPLRELFAAGVLPVLIAAPGAMVYAVLHELTHAAVMKACGAKGLRFGVTGSYAFAGSGEDYFGKRPYRAVALAPVLLWGLVLGLLCLTASREWFWVFWFWEVMNLAGSVGDLYVCWRLRSLPRDILVKDSGVSMRVYSAE